MTQITIQDGTVVVRDGKIGTSDSCCCQGTCDVKEGTSGGSGTTTNTYLFPSSSQRIKLTYEAYSVPDRFIVSACGTQYIDTGSLSGGGSKCFTKPEGCTSVTVTVEGPTGTAWSYELECDNCESPPSPCDPPCVDGEVCCGGACNDYRDCCDPPCDESNCERCVETNGVWGCESTCAEPYSFCCDGVCKDQPCDACNTNADCGCVYDGHTYYPALDAIFPGFGCCPPGTYFNPSGGYCWAGEPGTESVATDSERCCGGECVAVVQYPAGGCVDGGRECPTGCCPEQTYVCCPDGFSCAPCIQDCENLFP